MQTCPSPEMRLTFQSADDLTSNQTPFGGPAVAHHPTVVLRFLHLIKLFLHFCEGDRILTRNESQMAKADGGIGEGSGPVEKREQKMLPVLKVNLANGSLDTVPNPDLLRVSDSSELLPFYAQSVETSSAVNKKPGKV